MCFNEYLYSYIVSCIRSFELPIKDSDRQQNVCKVRDCTQS